MATHYAVNPATGERLMLLNNKWVPATSGASSSGAPKMTEAQAKDGFNAKRMAGAAQTINKLEGQGYDAGLGRIAGAVGLPITPVRSYGAAQEEWADAILRMTTGAAATKDEVKAMGKAYFPQFGDSEEVRAQKAAARKRVEEDARLRAGPAAAAPPSPQGRMRSTRRMGADMAAARGPARASGQGGWKILGVE